MLWLLRKDGLTSLFKEVRVFKAKGDARDVKRMRLGVVLPHFSRAAKRGGFQTGGASRSGRFVLPFLSFLGLSRLFPGFSRFARGLFGDFPDLPVSSFSAY